MRTRVNKNGDTLYEFCWWSEKIDNDGYAYMDTTVFVFTKEDLRQLKEILENV